MATEFLSLINTLKSCGIPHSIHHAPCAGNGHLGKDEEIQDAMNRFGHNVTSHCTTGVVVGDMIFVFFTGSSDVPKHLAGAFMFTLNQRTRQIEHHTGGRKIIGS